MYEVSFNKEDKKINIEKHVRKYNEEYDSKLKAVDIVAGSAIGIMATTIILLGTPLGESIALASLITTPIASCGVIKGFKIIKNRFIESQKKEILDTLELVSEQLANTNSNINTSAINIAESVIFTEVRKTSNSHKVDGVGTTIEEATSDTYFIFLDEKDRVQGILERESYSKPANSTNFETTTQQFVLERYDVSPFQKQLSKRLVKRLTKEEK